jgi:hypothetical protein
MRLADTIVLFEEKPGSLQDNEMTSEDIPIEVGGQDRLPEYARFYFEAARRLLNASGTDLDPVALPLVYLQRHCLELIIKEIHLASSCLADAKRLAEGKQEVVARPPEHHRLVELVDALEKSLSNHGFSAPSDLGLLASEMDTLEEKAPGRYRYAFRRLTKQQKKMGQGPDESFPNPQVLPVREIQARLEPLASAANYREVDSLVFKLCSECTKVLPSFDLI